MHCLPSSWRAVSGSVSMALVSTLLLSVPARGQTIGQIGPANVAWEPKQETNDLTPITVSYQNCLDNDEFVFTVRITDWTDARELLVLSNIDNTSIDCSSRNQRIEDDGGSCVPVGRWPRGSQTVEVNISVQELIGAAGPEACDEATYDGKSVNVYFLLVDGSDDLAGTSSYQKYDAISIDLVGPNAPTNVRADGGENKLLLKWSATSDTELQGYRFYCSATANQDILDMADYRPVADSAGGTGGVPLVSSAGVAGGGGWLDAAAGSTATNAAAGSTATNAAAGSAATNAAAGSAATNAAAGSTTTDTETQSGDSACQSSVLVAGERQTVSTYACGEVDSATTTEGKTSWVANGTEYAVGLAAVDSAGNIGPLSELACATPQEVDDFYEVYRRSGGQGGGGFCTLSPTSKPFGPFGMALLAAIVAWRLRRDREHRS